MTKIIIRLTNGEIEVQGDRKVYDGLLNILNDNEQTIFNIGQNISVMKSHIQFVQFVEEQPKEEK